MLYAGIFLANNCSNTNVEIATDPSNHVGRYVSDLQFYVVLQIFQSLGFIVDPFLEVTPEEVVRWVKIMLEEIMRISNLQFITWKC